jgi:LAGLIDADG endonuclease
MVINHFDEFPLKTNKLKDYTSFKKAYYIIKNKEHLTKQGLDKLTSIKSSMNLGLSPELKLAFPNIKTSLIKEPHNHNTKDGNIKANIGTINFNPNWISGFASGEGSFQVNIRKIKKLDNKYQVLLTFSIGQHSRDELLLKSLAKYLDCGKVIKKINSKNNTEFFEFSVSRFKDVNEKIISLFLKYPIQGIKFLDFQDFYNVANLMNKKTHLTDLGLNKIRLIKQGMNSNRI